MRSYKRLLSYLGMLKACVLDSAPWDSGAPPAFPPGPVPPVCCMSVSPRCSPWQSRSAPCRSGAAPGPPFMSVRSCCIQVVLEEVFRR